jgi:hypothetical protein
MLVAEFFIGVSLIFWACSKFTENGGGWWRLRDLLFASNPFTLPVQFGLNPFLWRL